MFDTAVPTTPHDILTITTQFDSETITFSTELVSFCLHLQQVSASEHVLGSLQPWKGELQGNPKTQQEVTSLIQHVESFSPEKPAKKSTALTAQKKKILILSTLQILEPLEFE